MQIEVKGLDEAKVLEAIKGYKIVDYRIPNKGEMYLDAGYKICNGVCANIVAYPIIEKVRWRAELGRRYYYISVAGGNLFVSDNIENCDYIDDNFYINHNYFETEALALDALTKIMGVLHGEG